MSHRLDRVPALVTRSGGSGQVLSASWIGEQTPDRLGLAEDVFVTLAESGTGPPRCVADSLVTRPDLERSLSVWTRFARHLSSSMSYRVIARVVDEARFKRTELRTAVTSAVAAHRPRWRVEDPADLELWVLEHQRARFVAGLRLSDKRMRQHGSGRVTERRGALRPVVAAAMVHLAGETPGRVLDPCCGSGTVLVEALSAGWAATPGAPATPHHCSPERPDPSSDVRCGGPLRSSMRADPHSATCSSDTCVSPSSVGFRHRLQPS